MPATPLCHDPSDAVNSRVCFPYNCTHTQLHTLPSLRTGVAPAAPAPDALQQVQAARRSMLAAGGKNAFNPDDGYHMYYTRFVVLVLLLCCLIHGPACTPTHTHACHWSCQTAALLNCDTFQRLRTCLALACAVAPRDGPRVWC